MSANVAYAIGLMQRGHPRTSAARAAGCDVAVLPSSSPRLSYTAPAPQPVPPSPMPMQGQCIDRVTDIMIRVGKPYGVTPKMMRDIRQTRKVAWPRHAAMAAIRAEIPVMSLPAIALRFGARDHTTVLYGIRQHQARIAWAEFLIWAAKP